jgi:predicted RNA polymerase sigma factor
LYYWNLGKLLSLTGKKSEAKSKYENAIKLVKISKDKEKKKLEQKLKQEMINFSSEKHGKPVTEI